MVFVNDTVPSIPFLFRNFQESINKDNEFAALLTNILKSFKCTDLNLTAKLLSYGVSTLILNL